MKQIWVLVADEAIARILRWPDEGRELEPVQEWTDPLARAAGTELRRDAEGRRAAGASPRQGSGAGMLGAANATGSAGQDPQHLQAERFARQVAQHLAQALQQRRFEHLHVAAAPRFLGLLRKAFDAPVAATVQSEVDKDLVHLSARELTAQLFDGRLPR